MNVTMSLLLKAKQSREKGIPREKQARNELRPMQHVAIIITSAHEFAHAPMQCILARQKKLKNMVLRIQLPKMLFQPEKK